MGILKFLLYALLPLFLMGNIFRIQIREGVFVTPIDVAIISLLPFAIFYLAQNSEKLKANPLTGYVIVFLAALLASLLLNLFYLDTQTSHVALMYFIRLFAYTQLMFLFPILGVSFSKKYLKLLFWTIFTSALLGILQYLFYNDLRNLVYLGWDEHLYRLFSTFMDPNFAGVIFSLGLAIGLYVLQKSSSRSKKASVVAQFIMFASLILTFSRTAFVSLFSTACVYLLKFMGARYAILLIVALLAAGTIFISTDPASEGVDLSRTASIQARSSEMRKGLEVFSSSPILGIGFNAYGAYAARESQFPDNSARGLPNSYVFTLATSGVVGLSALLYLFYGVYRLYKSTRDLSLKKLIFTTSLILATSAFFENTLYYNFVMFAYFSVLGIVISLKESSAH